MTLAAQKWQKLEKGEERLGAVVGCQKLAERWRGGSVASCCGLPENGRDAWVLVG